MSAILLGSFLVAAAGLLITLFWSRTRNSGFDPWVTGPNFVGIYIDEEDQVIATQYSHYLDEQRVLTSGQLTWRADKASVELVSRAKSGFTPRVWDGVQSGSGQAFATLGLALQALVPVIDSVHKLRHVGLVLPSVLDDAARDSVVQVSQGILGSSVEVLSLGPAVALSLRLEAPHVQGPQATLVLAPSGSLTVLSRSLNRETRSASLGEARYFAPGAAANSALLLQLSWPSVQDVVQVINLNAAVRVDGASAPFVYNMSAVDAALGGAIAALRAEKSAGFIPHVRLVPPVSIVLGGALAHVLLGEFDKAVAVRIVPHVADQSRVRVQLMLGARPHPEDNVALGELVLERAAGSDESELILCATARWVQGDVRVLVQVIDAAGRQRVAAELPFRWSESSERHKVLENLSNDVHAHRAYDNAERERLNLVLARERGVSSVGTVDERIFLAPEQEL
ncbi:hypothetical protein EXIGLDRAFT_759656 [Exidia glandulosa HHB12029]|uniref:Uncharacterized protein n=1 Tax=Exidia glandulosa HHB12029 TaxID=1314781 RepID=A0A165PQJ4_EXIGL|nr:hypothetical protein EXIGLDRAFT_759656 [Exidia glandulosa HHB12029]